MPSFKEDLISVCGLDEFAVVAHELETESAIEGILHHEPLRISLSQLAKDVASCRFKEYQAPSVPAPAGVKANILQSRKRRREEMKAVANANVEVEGAESPRRPRRMRTSRTRVTSE